MKVSLPVLLAITLLGCAAPLPEPPDLAERLAPYQEGPTVDVPLQEVVDTIVAELERTGLAQPPPIAAPRRSWGLASKRLGVGTTIAVRSRRNGGLQRRE